MEDTCISLSLPIVWGPGYTERLYKKVAFESTFDEQLEFAPLQSEMQDNVFSVFIMKAMYVFHIWKSLLQTTSAVIRKLTHVFCAIAYYNCEGRPEPTYLNSDAAEPAPGRSRTLQLDCLGQTDRAVCLQVILEKTQGVSGDIIRLIKAQYNHNQSVFILWSSVRLGCSTHDTT